MAFFFSLCNLTPQVLHMGLPSGPFLHWEVVMAPQPVHVFGLGVWFGWPWSGMRRKSQGHSRTHVTMLVDMTCTRRGLGYQCGGSLQHLLPAVDSGQTHKVKPNSSSAP